ncbi:MAG: type II/IV secretion system ATPase subunit [Thaumarchaeota archaeon]|nr:type II/IV secretion system ATPase subunit [Nitrososphaerota archaeon]
MFKGKKHDKKASNEPDIIEPMDAGKTQKVSLGQIQQSGIPENYVEIDRYPLTPPFAYAVITQNTENLEHLYVVDELPLTPKERKIYNDLKAVLEYDLKPAEENETPQESFRKQLPKIIAAHQDELPDLSGLEARKITYYATRDMLGLERIGPLMDDILIEDISCGGLNKPVYVWHKKYESMMANIRFETEEELDNFIVKLVHLSGKHISTTYPIVDATLPGKHRLSAMFRREVTPLGTSFTIRKFKEDPYTIIDLLNIGTINETIATYLWMLMDNKMSLMVLGSTGAGKTTALNAISGFIPASFKIFTVEEVAEINLPHENWVSSISRTGYGAQDEGAIGLFELLKAAVRHRPDYIVVGEVRGEEAYVLFQAVATGHGGLCTMHADQVEAGLKRLVQDPMNVPAASIPLMHCALVVKRVNTRTGPGSRSIVRRVTQMSEILGADAVKDISTWNPAKDEFEINISGSRLLKRIAESNGLTLDEVREEMERRKRVLRWMRAHNMRDYRKFSQTVAMYRKDPERVYRRAMKFTEIPGV